MGRTALQPFELQVLLAALRLGDDAYSVPIVLDLEERRGARVSQAAVFIAIRRLEKRGLMTSRLDDRSAETGRVRRLVRLTPAARRLLRETRDEHARLWRGLDRLLGDPRR
jgi:DNA-binding PadR family transcriptional regulator